MLVRATSSLELLEGVEVDRVVGDLTDEASLRRAVAGVERIFHVAAVYREAKLSDRVYRDVNVEGTRRLAEAALAEGGVPFLYCSTCGVHGDVAPPADESAPYNPGDIYQRTKVEAEQLLLGDAPGTVAPRRPLETGRHLRPRRPALSRSSSKASPAVASP